MSRTGPHKLFIGNWVTLRAGVGLVVGREVASSARNQFSVIQSFYCLDHLIFKKFVWKYKFKHFSGRAEDTQAWPNMFVVCHVLESVFTTCSAIDIFSE